MCQNFDTPELFNAESFKKVLHFFIPPLFSADCLSREVETASRTGHLQSFRVRQSCEEYQSVSSRGNPLQSMTILAWESERAVLFLQRDYFQLLFSV